MSFLKVEVFWLDLVGFILMAKLAINKKMVGLAAVIAWLAATLVSPAKIMHFPVFRGRG